MPIRDFTFQDIFSKFYGPCAMTCLKLMAEPKTVTLIHTHNQVEKIQLGFAIVQWKEDHSYLAEIATTLEARGQGVGRALLAESERRMREAYGPHLMGLHVAESNQEARKLFKGSGFRDQGSVLRYYKNERALWMVKDL